MGDAQSIRNLLKERDTEYGRAWLVSGKALSVCVHTGWFKLEKMIYSGFFYNWYIIFNKMVRLLHNPRHLDSWRDIAGYAQLVVDHIEKENAAGHESVDVTHEYRKADPRDQWVEGA